MKESMAGGIDFQRRAKPFAVGHDYLIFAYA